MGKAFQLELFKHNQFPQEKIKKGGHRPSFFAFLKNYERGVLIIISFFITALVSFSFGVERGKRLRLAQPTSKKVLEQVAKQPVQIEKPPATRQTPAVKTKETISKYTIQVATFKTKTYANKEAERLKKKGHEALIIPRGEKVIVCVGNFSKEQEASVALGQLKKTYHDCFIREL